ncbi:MAG: patatin family protein [Erysipelotrichaceae bacterium]|jgi:predicted patatin/cPLA2 family phospholipase|nr:patatin family protein [Erysipelotrichaceae bacterium]
MKVGLVLEGGGLRGAYTAGALSWLLDNRIQFDYAVGISSGAEHLCNYLVGDQRILREVAVKWAGSATKTGIEPLLKEGQLVGYDYLFNHVLKTIVPLDLDKIRANPVDAEFGLYDMQQCKTIWVKAKDLDPDFRKLKAACTLPLAGKPVIIDGKPYLDGGITSMTPIRRAMECGCEHNVVITTKSDSFVRKPTGFVTNVLMWCSYHKYKKMLKDLDARTQVYYQELAIVKEQIEQGKAVLINPRKELGVKRFSATLEQLDQLYDLGYSDMETKRAEIEKIVQKKNR